MSAGSTDGVIIRRYLTVTDIRDSLPYIRFRRPQDRDLWAHAVERWTRHG